MKEFVVVVDVQADFMLETGALSVDGAAALTEPMNDWLAARRPDDTAGILCTFDTHDAATYPGSAEAEQFPPHCYRGTPGWASVLDPGRIDPAIPCYRLEKGVFDMWAEPDVTIEPLDGGAGVDRDAFFDQLRGQGVEEVTVIGVAADYCVRWAVEGLLARGFQVTVPVALTRGIAADAAAVAAAIGSPRLTLA